MTDLNQLAIYFLCNVVDPEKRGSEEGIHQAYHLADKMMKISELYQAEQDKSEEKRRWETRLGVKPDFHRLVVDAVKKARLNGELS